ncbi:peptidylprolyl isomerase [Hydrogenovibrio marinus]|uniref:Peptidyl-prolyl cis-trans isomerase C n=1 Tax=Hydrogenovibrio marinus TaxID=28885 RepID=A0A067A307_HYDMR|nr:peptidylprolyl isomerase [Hydrogenovibrio marinus]KDN96710.1 peptidylprolyl isomerase [Hydrogenovibrio marinus]BBN58947.1 peptidyl-prolyl cis-trans isomerase [Hydrogenovibrio marinus]
MAMATARHILVNSEEKALELKQQILDGADFADVAKANSQCPSSRSGGDLGQFGPGMMVPEFDKVCFSADVGSLEGPVKTQFGYHLIQVTDRTE